MNRASSNSLPKSIMKNNNTPHKINQTISYSDRRCSQDVAQSRSSYSSRKRRSVQFHSSCQLIPIKDTEFELEEPQLSEILYVKHCFKTYGIRASNRSWTSCLVVCERGHLKLFKARSKDTAYTVDVSNLSNQLGTLSLQHSLARPLPQEHHSTKRPYLIQLDLPNGSMYMIQLSSATNIGNWVGVLNYWAARETTPPSEFPTLQQDQKRGKLSSKISTSSLFTKFLGNTTSAQGGYNSDWSPPLPPLSRIDFIQFQMNYHSKQSYEYSQKWAESPSGGIGSTAGTPYSNIDSPLPLNYLDSVTCLQTLQRPSSVASSTTLNLGPIPSSTSSQLISLHYQPSPSNRPIEKHRKSWSLSQRLSPIAKLKSLNLIKPQH
ncbi:hypothetical protein CONCODRAFT_73321 [Conidiobolus coronatus NRRL 28638]|uniref:Pleckstrin homology domain-containing protein n=1 Tax=Conidiobolus coronatus (strain ATCC 28846 / CBS 209.66 / NRRL 28638) TaxID=796925 RepID=A0A137NW94_CONC2|nr:hypothetical protein CONCODRAFT_73321 [Conidiobolus coronatus NRRL 28638]|eukprot:KXN66958.1 hypothetical protein CONCODRAFT_73321 [Conidiobolus coronatus NRRL 28638]